MQGRKNEKRALEYDDRALKLGVELYRKSETLLELLYHLMKGKKLHSFSAILLRSEMENFGTFLQTHKRKTDILYEIYPEEGIYALFCQETQVDGGFYFIRRLTGMMDPETVNELRVAIIGVEGTSYPLKNLIFIMLDNFLKANAPEGERIIYRTVK